MDAEFVITPRMVMQAIAYALLFYIVFYVYASFDAYLFSLAHRVAELERKEMKSHERD